ncbi:MAG: hypothetical protein ACRETX_17735, partial [Steroidobacteraceae bacterium]
MSVRTAPISRRTFLAAGATLPLASACRSSSRGETVEFWAMGREAEVVADLLPDIPIDVQQLAWTAAHQKLLTAFAG